MTAEVPETVPSELIAGDTWAFTRDYDDYPAGTWGATLYAENAAGQFSIAATASSTTHSFAKTAALSAAVSVGRFRWFVRVTSGSEAYTVEDGWLDVKPNPASAGARDHRSHARRVLDAIEATLERKATADQSAMTLNGRSISRIPLPELLALQDKYRARVQTEEDGATAGRGRNIKARHARV